MKFSRFPQLTGSICLVFLALIAPVQADQGQKQNNSSCPTPVLSRLQKHTIAAGESIDSIAQKYNLIPETLVRLNPILKSGNAPVGKEILIPPFNGIKIQAPAGATWRDLAASYGVSADVLFEINGCQKKPSVVFIPGITWSGRQRQAINYGGFSGYPFAKAAPIALGYGWQNLPDQPSKFFHSGIDLLANIGTNVLAVEEGTVVFAGQQENYGNLVVINHRDGMQTRYAHLSSLKVATGKQVKTGDLLGAVGQTGKPDINKPHLHFEVRYKSNAGWVAQDPTIHLQAKFPSGL
jgi:murein DD-endopeptidase MepM/ murein hydrolase activator NlpD